MLLDPPKCCETGSFPLIGKQLRTAQKNAHQVNGEIPCRTRQIHSLHQAFRLVLASVAYSAIYPRSTANVTSDSAYSHSVREPSSIMRLRWSTLLLVI